MEDKNRMKIVHPKYLDDYKDLPLDHMAYKMNYFIKESSNKQNDINPTNSLKEEKSLLHAQQKEALLSLSSSYEVEIIKAKTDGKLVHGFGSINARETSISIHSVYGIPYIPASSVKGAMRNWVIQACFNGMEPDQSILSEESEANEEQQHLYKVYLDLFGSEKSRGMLQCMDAFIASKDFKLEKDVMTVHHKEYYSGKQESLDNQKLDIINFYVLNNKEINFPLFVAKKEGRHSKLSSNKLLDEAICYLKNALKETGIGSKKSSSYGYFKEINDLDIRKEVYKKHEKAAAAKAKAKAEAAAKAEKLKLEKMTDAERLVYKIQQFKNMDQGKDESKSPQIFKKVLELAEQGELEPAQELKAYWKEINQWDLPKKKKKQGKQLEKIERLKKHI
ncbi:type III-B CRISPR module RAMP protein Cmr6 [Longirhabdus pacifica]|uniref:type III-B CRISPR module RAMP protein Cmr6 n=1 Tax=Longirhabdus pacifica TaxID=2305227 RepID=UPI0010089E43|nr:type III-B CRISPR module RAMP protein Cmr6 [Longirhabdus pacifica]